MSFKLSQEDKDIINKLKKLYIDNIDKPIIQPVIESITNLIKKISNLNIKEYLTSFNNLLLKLNIDFDSKGSIKLDELKKSMYKLTKNIIINKLKEIDDIINSDNSDNSGLELTEELIGKINSILEEFNTITTLKVIKGGNLNYEKKYYKYKIKYLQLKK